MDSANTNPLTNTNNADVPPAPPKAIQQAGLKNQRPLNAMFEAGYVTYTGYVFTQVDADAYNRFTREIEAERYEPTKEFLRDQRHRYFVLVCNSNSSQGVM